MANVLRLTFRFLQPFSHGRRDNEEPEWPPSPLRVFQAMVAASAARWNERTQISLAIPALRWLESCPQPVIVSCVGNTSQTPTQFYVPDNTADLLVPSWKKGDTKTTVKRTDKVVQPTHLGGELVHFLYNIGESVEPYFETLKAAARSVTHIGWGIDMVVGDADLISREEAAALEGDRWVIANSGGTRLRVPQAKTLDDLMRKHSDFLGRVTDEGFRPVSPLREFDVKHFRRTTDPEQRPYCIFQILRPDAKGNRAFGAARKTRDVAAWVRHAVADVCKGWSDLASFVHGHAPDGGANRGPHSHLRFQYLPLPTISKYDGNLRAGAIRRVMISAPVGCEDRIDFIRKRLIGRELIWQNETVGILNLASQTDWIGGQYTGYANEWCSVAPVILDGFDDHNPNKTHRLIQKALANAGIGIDAQFDWQPFGYLAGIEPVRAFVRPEKLNGTMVHLKIRFAHGMCGPIVLGAGRFRGFGLMAVYNSIRQPDVSDGSDISIV